MKRFFATMLWSCAVLFVCFAMGLFIKIMLVAFRAGWQVIR